MWIIGRHSVVGAYPLADAGGSVLKFRTKLRLTAATKHQIWLGRSLELSYSSRFNTTSAPRRYAEGVSIRP